MKHHTRMGAANGGMPLAQRAHRSVAHTLRWPFAAGFQLPGPWATAAYMEAAQTRISAQTQKNSRLWPTTSHHAAPPARRPWNPQRLYLTLSGRVRRRFRLAEGLRQAPGS
ncbi:MAG TPA: hypothetical protein VK737_10675 [Opitutales bacterium]|nr:hypothetical protein [Opitutales bacterium]